MKKAKILLLTDVFPSKNYSGAILSLQLCRYILEEKYPLYCACIKSASINEDLDDEVSSEIETIFFEKPIENGKLEINYQEKVDKIALDVIKYIKEKKIDVVWCPVQGETLLKIFAAIQKNLPNVRAVSQVWDPIEWILHDLKYTDVDSVKILKIFRNVMKNSYGILTASDYMNIDYKKQYNKNCYPSFVSLDLPESKSKLPKEKNKFIINMSGQTYANVGLKSLFAALDEMNWQYKDQEIIFRYFGTNKDAVLVDNPHVDYRGFILQEKLLEEQRKANLLYCSYFFEENEAMQLVSRQSYPSKVTTYIPSEVPIIVHSPKDTSVYKHVKKYNAGYLLDSLNTKKIIEKIKSIIDARDTEQENELIINAKKLFQDTFNKEKNKDYLFKALGLPYTKEKKYSILEVNYVDLPGKRFNGYDIMEYINKETIHSANQIVTYKTSENNNVIKLYNNLQQELEYLLLNYESNTMSLHSCLSSSSPILVQKDCYKHADLLHIHMIHNMKLSLISLIDICNDKPSIISIHDPWTFTGRCVHYEECDKYLTGCKNCPNLSSLFPLKKDNCNELWKVKKLVYDNIDVDYVVSSKYMYDLFKASPLTKDKRVHLIPFGIDVDFFSKGMTRQKARDKYGIEDDEIVLFHRAQKEFKGTNYVVEALEKMNVDKKVTVITCSEVGHFNSLKNRYKIIDLGNVDSEELKYAYNACDVFLMPSIGESFGMMAIEAMSCGKPVIVFNNTALPSVTFAPECGIAVENKNSDKLREAIELLITNNDERLKRGALARKIVEENYDINIYNKKMEELYYEVLNRKHNFDKLLLSQKIEDSQDVRFTKYLLNMLSRKLFDVNSPECKELYYDLGKDFIFDGDYKIKYGDKSVQLVIHEYNTKMVKLYKRYYVGKDDEWGYPGLARFKIYRQIKRFLYLLIHDRPLLKITISRKLNRFPKVKAFLKKIYYKIKK